MIPILRTKLRPPQRHDPLIERPQLLRQLHQALDVPLTVVVAPAGFGKTTLLSTWLDSLSTATLPPAVAWLALDAHDRDPTLLLHYLVAALQPIAPTVGTATLSVLRSPQPPPLELALVPLINDLDAFGAPLIVIFDDYQEINTLPISQLMSLLIARLPPNVHLVLASRTEPQLPLARLRARRTLVEIRSTDLRMSTGESAELLTKLVGQPLDAASLSLLDTEFEGWVAGLHLTGLALRDQAKLSNLLAAISTGARYSMEYLAQEVVADLPADLQDVLLGIAILDRVCADLCAALVTAVRQPALTPIAAQALLEEFTRRGLFFTPIDHTATWYRYHHLFRELLYQQLQRSATPAQIAELHRRAAAWMADQGMYSEAIDHAIAGQHPDAAVELIVAHALPLIFSGQLHTVQIWLSRLPAHYHTAQPQIALISGWAALFSNDAQVAQVRLEQAHAVLAAEGTLSPQDQAALAALQATLTSFGERYDQAVQIGTAALHLLEPQSPLRIIVHASLVFTHLLGNQPLIAEQRATAELAALADIPEHNLLRIHYQTILLICYRLRGDLQRALQIGNQSLALLATVRGGVPLPTSVPALTEQAMNRYESGDWDGALILLREAQALCNLGTMERLRIPPTWLEARLLAASGDLRRACDLLKTVAATAHRLDLPLSQMITAGELVAMALRCDDLATAHQASEMLADHALVADGLRPGVELYLAPSRMCLATGKITEALADLTALHARAITAERHLLALKTLLLIALGHAAQQNTAAAHKALATALHFGARTGFIAAFRDEGTPLFQLLASYPAHTSAEHNFIQQVQIAFQHPAPRTQPTVFTIEPLTHREYTILRLLASGYSNREIADDLVVALGTVKRHVANLAAKLGTTSRLETVARARTLGLL
jgi:LuxR family maltose regulon positive regulatory protein